MDTRNTTTQAEQPKLKVLHINQMQQPATYHREIYRITLDETTSLPDALMPGFWAHHTDKLRPGAMIEIVSGDYELDAAVRVISVDADARLVDVRPIWIASTRDIDEGAEAEEVEEPDEDDLPDLPAGYEVKFNPKSLWRVRWSGVDPAVWLGDQMSKAEAYAYAVEHAERAKGA